MNFIRADFRSMLWLMFVTAAPLSSMPVEAADCAHWDIGGHWEIKQANGFTVTLDLTQNGTDVQGTGSFVSDRSPPNLAHFNGRTEGSINGTIDQNNNILLNASWGGVYRGGVGSDAFIGGTTFATNDPGNQVVWRSTRTATCPEPTATTPPSSAALPPVKAIGKIKPPSAAPAATMNPATVELDVEIYNKPGGGDAGGVVIGELAKGTQGVIANCESDNWCQVSQWIGKVPVHRGWVYSGPDYKSLAF